MVGIIILILALSVLIYANLGVIRFFKRAYDANIALKQFPLASEKYHWLFGHLVELRGASEEALLKMSEWTLNNPRYYRIYGAPWRTALMVNHPESAKQILKTTQPKALTGIYRLIRPWLGDGLLLSKGDKWFRNRRLLTPGFHFDVLKPYMDVYNKCVDTMMLKFQEFSSKTDQSIDIFKPVSLCTLDIILRCAFSTEKDVQGQGEKEPYVNTVVSLGKLMAERIFKPFYWLNFLYYRTSDGKRFKRGCDYSREVASSVMQKRRKELTNLDGQTRKGRYVDFLDILLLARDESGAGLSDNEIRDEVVTFMFEGHDTTASGISWILYNLARHPEIQAKARAEVDSVLSGRDKDTIEWDDLTQLPYLTMCIKESLRLHPPVHFISRQIEQPFSMDNKALPPDTLVSINIWNIHHNPAVWPDPMKYDPERFRLENISKMDSHAFVPFSAGPRNCIGQNFAMNEMKTTVARVLRKFEFKPDPNKPVRILPDVVLRAESGIHLYFKERETCESQ